MTNMEFFMVIISIVSPIAVGLFVRSGVKAQIKANENNISKQVKEELEKEMKLLMEKIRIKREDRWWNVKLDLFIEVSNLLLSIFEMIAKKDYLDAVSIIRGIAIRTRALFSNTVIGDKIKDCSERILMLNSKSAITNYEYEVGKIFGNVLRLMEEELEIKEQAPNKTS